MQRDVALSSSGPNSLPMRVASKPGQDDGDRTAMVRTNGLLSMTRSNAGA